MTSIQFIYLREVLKYGSLSLAARSLYVTPQAIGKSLKSLERELGVSLFEHKGNRIESSSFSKLVLERGERILAIEDEIRSLVRGVANGNPQEGSFRIGFVTDFFRGSVLSEMEQKKFFSLFPSVRFKQVYESSAGLVYFLRERALDAALILGAVNDDELISYFIANPSFKVLLKQDHPLANKGQVRALDLEPYPVATPFDIGNIRGLVDKRLKTSKLRIHLQSVHPSVEGYSSFYDEGGVVVTPFSIFPLAKARAVKVLAFTQEDTIAIPFSLVYRRDNGGPLMEKVKKQLAAFAPHCLY